MRGNRAINTLTILDYNIQSLHSTDTFYKLLNKTSRDSEINCHYSFLRGYQVRGVFRTGSTGRRLSTGYRQPKTFSL